MFFRFILWWVFCYFGDVWAVQKSTLEICFFNTGQGNCIALRSNDIYPGKVDSKLIFIDCGGGAIRQNGCGEVAI